jgi:hypothetical protein
LNWKTVTEVNNLGFDVERSANKSDWTKIAFVQGHQNSTSTISYSYLDKSVNQSGKYFYRLKQIDNNGSFKYSNIIETDLISPSVFTLNQNYPNPFNPVTTIEYVLGEKSTTKLTLLNAIGEEVAVIVNQEQNKGYHKVDFKADNLPSGVYFYRLQAGSFVETKKMILLK